MTASLAGRASLVVGYILLVAVGILIAVSGLIMPAWAVGVLALIWLAAVVAAVRWRGRPGLVLAVPFALLAVWLLTAWVGDRVWGWTA